MVLNPITFDEILHFYFAFATPVFHSFGICTYPFLIRLLVEKNETGPTSQVLMALGCVGLKSACIILPGFDPFFLSYSNIHQWFFIGPE